MGAIWGLFRVLDEVVFALLGLLVAFNIGHLTTLKRCESALLALTLESKALTSFDPSSIAETLEAKVGDIVAETLHMMRPPSIADHLGGAIAQFAQMKMMKAMAPEELLQAMAPPAEGDFINHIDD